MYFVIHRLYVSLIFVLISICGCYGADYAMRVDVLPPCIENENNSARFGALDVRRLVKNQFQLNGTLIVNRTIIGPLEVSKLLFNYYVFDSIYPSLK